MHGINQQNMGWLTLFYAPIGTSTECWFFFSGDIGGAQRNLSGGDVLRAKPQIFEKPAPLIQRDKPEVGSKHWDCLRRFPKSWGYLP